MIMIKVNEPYSHYTVAIVDNEFFQRDGNYQIDLKVDTHGVTAIKVNHRDLNKYEWECKEGCYYITLKDWA